MKAERFRLSYGWTDKDGCLEKQRVRSIHRTLAAQQQQVILCSCLRLVVLCPASSCSTLPCSLLRFASRTVHVSCLVFVSCVCSNQVPGCGLHRDSRWRGWADRRDLSCGQGFAARGQGEVVLLVILLVLCFLCNCIIVLNFRCLWWCDDVGLGVGGAELGL